MPRAPDLRGLPDRPVRLRRLAAAALALAVALAPAAAGSAPQARGGVPTQDAPPGEGAGQAPAGEARPARVERLVPVESDATRAAAESAREELRVARELARDGQRAAARATIGGAVDDLLALPGAAESAEVAGALHQLGLEAWDLNDSECVLRALQPVLAFRCATLGEDAEEVQRVRAKLGTACWPLGRYAQSREWLGAALEWAERTLPPADPRRLDALSNWGVTLSYLGDFRGARVAMDEVVSRLLETHSPDDPEIQWAFANRSNVLDALGDVDGAAATRERVHRTLSRARPAGDPDVMVARQNLALSLRRAGDPIGARVLLESVDAWNAKRYPAGHVSIERTRQNLALALADIGDLESARILLEGVVERLSKTRGGADPTLLNAEENLVAVLESLGLAEEVLARARELLARRVAAHGEDHLDVLGARTDLARALRNLGRHAEAAELFSSVLESLEEHHPENDFQLLITLGNAGNTCVLMGRLDEAARHFERARALAERRLGPDHDTTLHLRASLAGAVEDADPGRAHALFRELAAELPPILRRATAALSPREAELRARKLREVVDVSIGSCRAPEDAALVLELVEAVRLASWAGPRALAALDRACAESGEVRALRDELRLAGARVAECAVAGRREDYQRAAFERAGLEQRLAALVRGYADAPDAAGGTGRIAARLAPREAAISIRRYTIDRGRPGERQAGRYVAFVLRRGAEPRRVELGPAAEIDAAVARWRAALGIGAGSAAPAEEQAAGAELRRLCADPLRAAAGDAERWIVATDDALHLIPLDALPLPAAEPPAGAPRSPWGGARGGSVVGDLVRVEMRTHLAELDRAQPAREGEQAARDFVALGGIDFDAALRPEPGAGPAAVAAAAGPGEATAAVGGQGARFLLSAERTPPRSAPFAPLAASAAEVDGIAALFRARAEGGAEVRVARGAAATKPALAALAPRARWLHVATHGFSAPESLASLEDERARVLDFAREVHGLSPRVLCGLALAGANAPEDLSDRARGVLTAEELAYLELGGCELAVLSACDSSLGVRRAGQAVASLQNALHAAGARSSITALWRVSDTSSRELMLAFYRGLWESGLAKDEALWRAKQELRRKRAPTREWAAWVLTGDPR